MAQQLIKLDGYTYPHNPVENPKTPVRAVSVSDALTGRVYNDWGSDPSRNEFTQKWATLNAAQFETLTAKALKGGTLSYVDDDGTSYTVIALPPTYKGKTPGADAYLDVEFKLYIVSSP